MKWPASVRACVDFPVSWSPAIKMTGSGVMVAISRLTASDPMWVVKVRSIPLRGSTTRHRSAVVKTVARSTTESWLQMPSDRVAEIHHAVSVVFLADERDEAVGCLVDDLPLEFIGER